MRGRKMVRKIPAGSMILNTINLFLCILLLPTYVFSQWQITDKTKEENSAVYYSKAMDLLNFPNIASPLFKKINETVQRGWLTEDKDLEAILKQNELVLDEVDKGVLLKRCDFDFGKGYKYLITKKLPNILTLRNIMNLLILKGRFQEKKGNFDKAIECYLQTLTFAQHLSQDNTTVLKILSLAIEKQAYLLIKQYLKSDRINKDTCEKISNYLGIYEKEHFPFVEFIEVEKESFISAIQMMLDGLKLSNSKAPDEVKDSFSNEFKIQAHEIADRYYGNFIKAAQTNKEGDWEFALTDSSALTKYKQKDDIATIEELFNIFYEVYKDNKEEAYKRFVNIYVMKTLAIMLPDFKRVLENHYNPAMKELESLKLLAEEKTIQF